MLPFPAEPQPTSAWQVSHPCVGLYPQSKGCLFLIFTGPPVNCVPVGLIYLEGYIETLVRGVVWKSSVNTGVGWVTRQKIILSNTFSSKSAVTERKTNTVDP